MLTNVFYYGVYKPYILDGGRVPVQGRRRDVKAVLRDLSGNVSITKNNSIKQDVVDYASGVFKNVTDMKEASKYLNHNAGTYYQTVLEEDLDTAKDWALEDLSAFSNAFNAAVKFSKGQGHSPELSRYGEDLEEIAEGYKNELKNAGIEVLKDGDRMVLSVNPNKLKNMDYLELGSSLSGATLASEAVYGRTSMLLESPLYNHMDFRQLSFYYNYGIGPSGKKSPSMLMSGIILDRAI